MGANTYRLMSGLASDGEPGTDTLAGLSEVVFSSTLTEPLAWPNTQLVTQNPVEAVREMKDNATTSMRTWAASPVLAAEGRSGGLVPVVVFPVITGATGSDRIYDGYPTSPSTWSPAAPLTVGCSCSSTSPRCWPGRPAPPRPTPNHPALATPELSGSWQRRRLLWLEHQFE